MHKKTKRENFAMGMLRNGCWVEQDDIIRNKVFQRAASSIRVHAPGAIARRITERPGDFWLIGSYSCPWSHRTLLMRAIKQLPLPVHYAFGPRREGYSLNGGEAWKIPGSSKSARHLHELYTKHDPTYSGRVTVPVLWDSDQQQIITNESAEILTILDAVETQNGFDCTLRPFALRSEMEVANARMYHGLNNAVYRAGFAQSQDAYEEAVATVFETLDFLEQRLA
ncbi:MAG: glutathione-dependent reductase, partial [Pseudomonadota bacterium]